MAKKSTLTNLVGFSKKFTEAIDKKTQVDIQKAFDTVDNFILLKTFQSYGFPPFSSSSSYLAEIL